LGFLDDCFTLQFLGDNLLAALLFNVAEDFNLVVGEVLDLLDDEVTLGVKTSEVSGGHEVDGLIFFF